MQETTAILVEQQRFGTWTSIVLRSLPLTSAKPGQYLALRCTRAGSFDPLIRQPVFVVATEPIQGTITLLLNVSHPAYAFISGLPVGATVDIMGPLGKGWQVDETVRTLALVGTTNAAPELFSLAHHATRDGVAVTVLLGGPSRDDAPPPFLLPAAAEYNVAQSKAFASAAIALLDDQLLRWADMVAIALPHEYLTKIAQRINNVRIRWSRGFAQVAILPPLACCVGVCGVCTVETRHTERLACVDGPVFDLRDLVR